MIGKGWLRDYKKWEQAAEGADAVQTDLNNHKALTTTAHGGLVASGDSRLTDARTPTAHAASHITGGDKLQLAADNILGRATAGTGNIESIPCTAAGRAILDDAAASDQRTTLGLGAGDTPTFLGCSFSSGQASGTLFNAEKSYEFASFHLGLCSDPRLLLTFLTAVASGGTESDLSGKANTANYVVAGTPWASTDRTVKGFGFDLAFNGSTKYLNIADSATLTFGTGAADSAFTIVGVFKVTNSTTARNILYKGKSTTATEREWGLFFNTTPRLAFIIVDGSANKTCTRTLDGALTNGQYYHIAMTYSGVGGDTAANGITLYVNGVLAASTATNQAGYVAMENTTESVGVGAFNDGSSRYYDSNMNFLLVDASAWTAAKVWQSYVRSRGQFNI